MKRLLTLLALLALAVFGTALAQPSPLPDDSRFDQPVQFVTDAGGASLRGMLQALSESVGLVPVFGDFADRSITQEIDTPTPFRQVWSLVMNLYGLDYLLQDNDVVVVGTPQSIQALRPAPVQSAPVVVETPDDEPVVSQTYRINNPAEAVTGQLEALVPGISVEALPLGNSIVVRGTEAQQAEVQSVLDQFDVVVTAAAVVVDPVEQRTYQLANAKAAELAAVLQASGVVTTTTGSGDSATTESTSIIENFSVTAEPRTNSLIVTATRPVQAQLAELIPTLDVPQRQVNVQLRIQEIQRRTAQNFGLDVDADFGNLSVNILNGGLSLESIFNANPFISGLNILAVLDALETQGLSRRVDDSNITVLDNETGRVQSGGRIELQFAGIDGELSFRTIEFGVIINVTPRISNDGRVILEVSAEVSDVLVPLSEGGIPQRIDFSDREVTTTVTLEQGQTVMLGGLLQNQFSSTENRIPILGSIPLIGDLFSSNITSEQSGELLLVINAQVIE
jgi:type II secretory pathway component GspD/PulD (secretin)